MIQYRKAGLADYEKVYRLICELECKELPAEKFYAIYQEQINDSRYYCLICEQEGRVIGVLNLRFENQLHHAENIAEIMEFIVDSACRGQGVGKGMLEEACRVARHFGCAQIEAASNQLRTDTHRFYLREGMHNFHDKFSMLLTGENPSENIIGR